MGFKIKGKLCTAYAADFPILFQIKPSSFMGTEVLKQ